MHSERHSAALSLTPTSELDTLPVERHLLRLFGRLELSLARLLEMGERCAEIVDLLLELHLVLTKRDELLARPRHLPWSSEVIRGHPRSSEVIGGHRRSSEVIRGGHQIAINGHQRSSELLARLRHLPRARLHRRWQSEAIAAGNQRQSEAIRSNHLPVRFPCLHCRLQTPCAQPMH